MNPQNCIRLISTNKGKQAEFALAFQNQPQWRLDAFDWDLDEPQEIDSLVLSRKKLEQAKIQAKQNQITSDWLLIDDTALCLEELGGLPGPFIKWFLQALPLIEITKLRKSDHPSSAAKAICLLGLANLSIGKDYFFRGEVAGIIVKPRGNHNHGWDSIFQPLGSNLTYAEMTIEQKHKFSHRGKAIENLLRFLAPVKEPSTG